MELLGKRDLSIEEDETIRKMLSISVKINYNQDITDLTINLRRKEGLKLPDAIIAATAQYLKLPLLTADKAFSEITSIDCVLLELNA
jgi:hypothetical protein